MTWSVPEISAPLVVQNLDFPQNEEQRQSIALMAAVSGSLE